MARGAGGKPGEACRVQLVSAGLQHLVAPSESSEPRHPLSGQHGCVTRADRHRAGKRHRFERTGEGDQSRGRRGVVSPTKHGPSKPGQWRKVPLGIDADRLEIRAIEGEPVRAIGSSEPARGIKSEGEGEWFRPRNTGLPSLGSGARSIWGLMRIRLKSGRLRSPVAGLVMSSR